MITVAVVAVVVLLLVMAIVTVAMATGMVAPPDLVRRLRERDVVRRSAIEQDRQARRAAQQLALMAWRARHELYDLANEQTPLRSGTSVRRR